MDIPLLDAIDLDILMHRDVHFGGSFDLMLDYYQNDGVGVMPDFEIERILELKEIQEEIGSDLSSQILPLPAVEEIHKAQEMYHKLRAVYDEPHKIVQRLISDLILTEEEEPEQEIEALAQRKEEAVGPLIHLMDASYFYDPLYPGYGRAPMFAAKALSLIQDPKAIYHLFQALGQENFFVDEAIISALIAFGNKGQEFLLERVQEKPFNRDNEHAAIVLSSFPPNEEIGQIALSMLLKKETLKLENFSAYLICACEGLKKESDRKAFYDLSKEATLADTLKNEIRIVTKTWTQ